MWRDTLSSIHREDLKQSNLVGDQLKDAIFQRQLVTALQKQKKDDESLSYAEKVNRDKYTPEQALVYKKAFKVEGDDKMKTKLWASMMSDATFYYDNPTIDDEV